MEIDNVGHQRKRHQELRHRRNLIKALDKLKINDHPHLTVRNAEGRWTAVFLHSNFNRQWLWGKEGMSYLAFYAEKGFMTVG